MKYKMLIKNKDASVQLTVLRNGSRIPLKEQREFER